jgi:hypothetical protein
MTQKQRNRDEVAAQSPFPVDGDHDDENQLFEPLHKG